MIYEKRRLSHLRLASFPLGETKKLGIHRSGYQKLTQMPKYLPSTHFSHQNIQLASIISYLLHYLLLEP